MPPAVPSAPKPLAALLKVLGAHDGAQTRTADGPAVFAVDHDRGVADQLLTGWPDARYAGFLTTTAPAADLFAHQVVGFEGVLAPEVGRLAELDLAVADPEIDGFGGLASDDQCVEAGFFQVVCPVAAALGLAPDAG